MLHPLDGAFVQRRMDTKYGASRPPCAVRAEDTVTNSMDDTCVRFLVAPAQSTRNDSAAYAPRSLAVDARRKRLCDVYRNVDELQDMRYIVTVPACLMHVTRAGMRHVFAIGSVRIRGMPVALVSTREVGALLFEVVRNTCDLEPRHCTRLVAHMCKNDNIATEWLACFGP